jgi:hypothetical protein
MLELLGGTFELLLPMLELLDAGATVNVPLQVAVLPLHSP